MEGNKNDIVLETQLFWSTFTGEEMSREEAIEAMQTIRDYIGSFTKVTGPGDKQDPGAEVVVP